MTLEQFEQMPNAAKRDQIAKVPTADLFIPALETDFRNGIGHHAAHYEQEPDAIVIFDTKAAGTVSHVTRREGRPFTLVLTKTEALFEREAAERARWDRDQRWLAKTAGVF